MILAVFSLVSIIAVGWVANDAARRHRFWFGWAFLVGNTSVLGLILWLFVRRRSPASDARPGFWRKALLWSAFIPVGLLNLVISTFVVTFLFQPARVDGVAMAPTVRDHDRVIVNKMVYRFATPQRGDIVMLRYPLNPEKMFIKRIIARDGDTVRITQGRVYVNDDALDDGYVPGEFRSHDDWGPEVIRGGYFVLGDHRNNSSDSRHWGIVPANYIVGKVQVRWWPMSRAGSVDRRS